MTLMRATPTVIVAHELLGARTIKELIALLKANPGKFSYSSAGTGTPAHLAGELFKAEYGVDIIHVPFTGGGPAMNSTVGGHTPVSFPALSTAAPSILGGKVRGLAVMSPKRSSTLPDVPTMVTGSSRAAYSAVSGCSSPAVRRRRGYLAAIDA